MKGAGRERYALGRLRVGETQVVQARWCNGRIDSQHQYLRAFWYFVNVPQPEFTAFGQDGWRIVHGVNRPGDAKRAPSALLLAGMPSLPSELVDRTTSSSDCFCGCLQTEWLAEELCRTAGAARANAEQFSLLVRRLRHRRQQDDGQMMDKAQYIAAHEAGTFNQPPSSDAT